MFSTWTGVNSRWVRWWEFREWSWRTSSKENTRQIQGKCAIQNLWYYIIILLFLAILKSLESGNNIYLMYLKHLNLSQPLLHCYASFRLIFSIPYLLKTFCTNLLTKQLTGKHNYSDVFLLIYLDNSEN